MSEFCLGMLNIAAFWILLDIVLLLIGIWIKVDRSIEDRKESEVEDGL